MALCARGWDLLFCLFLLFHSAKSHPSFPFTSCFQRTHHYKASPALSPIKAKNHVTSLPGAVGRALYVSPRSRNVTKQEKQQSSHPLLSLFLWLLRYSARSRKQWINNRESKYYMRSPEPKRVGRCASTCLALSSSSWPVPIWQIPFTGLCLIRMYYLPLPKEYKNKTHQLLPSFLVGREKGGEETNGRDKGNWRVLYPSDQETLYYYLMFPSICSDGTSTVSSSTPLPFPSAC